jgi:phospholipase/carboxylesterase
MEIQNLGPLRVRIGTSPLARHATPQKDGDKPLTCVLLHGFGAPGNDLVGLAGALEAPSGTTFVFPEALHSLADFVPEDSLYPGMGEARAWWMIDMAAIEQAIVRGEIRDLSRQVPEGLAEARRALSSMLDELAKRRPGDRLVLGGFSQGAMLALDVALREPERPIAGIALLSGTLLAEEEWTPRLAARKGTAVFQSHGRSDPILPFSLSERLAKLLAEAGLAVTFVPFAGRHTIPDATVAKLGAWLRDAR